MSREVVVLSAVRSAIGTFGGALADFDSSELAGIVMKESVARSGVDPQQISYVTVGTCLPTPVSLMCHAWLQSRLVCRWNPLPCR